MSDHAHLSGLWRRLTLSIPERPIDTLTDVVWLQGPGFYGDLRRPGDLAVSGARGLNDLSMDDMAALCRQEGFAGEFLLQGDIAEWQRSIDFRAASPLGDRGRLECEGELVVEHGIDLDYIEYWQRESGSALAPAGLRLVRDDGRPALLIRSGTHFVFARGRAEALPPGADLFDLVRGAPSVERAREIIDCEVSVGRIGPDGWRVERSTLPFRAGAMLLGPDTSRTDSGLALQDVDPSGQPVCTRFSIVEERGEWRTPVSARRTMVPVQGERVTGTDFTAIPVIDISALESGDHRAEDAVVEAIGQAARSVGFLQITGHGIAPALTSRLRATTERFFAQPEEIKMRSYIGHSSNHRGYVPEGEEGFGDGITDRKEAFDLALDLDSGDVHAGHPMLGPNQWPHLPGFRDDVMAYYAAAFMVGRRLLRGFARALGLDAHYFDDYVTRPPSQLRLIHYPYDPAATDVRGIGAHTDYECFTLLLPTAPGLEVMNRAGEWIDAPPVPGALVVNIGDMLEYWSGGAFVATSHRVRKVAEERYSFPLFFAVDYDTRIAPLNATGTEEPLIAGEHLFAQTAQTFRYLKQRQEDGTLVLPRNAWQYGSFGQHARA